MSAIESLVRRTEERRIRASAELAQNMRARLGQFFTPCEAADLIAGLPRPMAVESLRCLDPGAGVGSLSAAVVARVVREGSHRALDLVAVEVDTELLPYLEETLRDCIEVAAQYGIAMRSTILNEDVFNAVAGLDGPDSSLGRPFDLVIMNPPYRKLNSNAPERLALASQGADCSNIYSGFLAIGAAVLRPGGQLTAIVPRSFANGPYFGPFRKFFLNMMALDKIHTFESRSTVFGDAGVLQENVVIAATRQGARGTVNLSISNGHKDTVTTRQVDYRTVVDPSDPHKFIRVLAGDADLAVSSAFANLPCAIHEVPVQVSTGRVVDFRTRENLLPWPEGDSFPLIYPSNLRAGRVEWPMRLRKPQALGARPGVAKLLLPHERYVLVKRFSSKEERRRVVAALFEPNDFDHECVGFENHLNVFHQNSRGLPQALASGLNVWLNSTIVDRFFRTFSGHTQVNATDLRSLRYPTRCQLEELGCAVGFERLPDQEKIDALVGLHILAPNVQALEETTER